MGWMWRGIAYDVLAHTMHACMNARGYTSVCPGQGHATLTPGIPYSAIVVKRNHVSSASQQSFAMTYLPNKGTG